MTPRRKSMLIISAVIAALFLLIIISSFQIILGGFIKLEAEEMRVDVERAQKGFANELAQLNMTASDWAFWNQTYDFIITRNPGYIQSNLSDTSLGNIKLEMMLFFNTQGQLVYGKALDSSTGRSKPIPAAALEFFTQHQQLLLDPPVSGRSGLLILDGKLTMLAALPILNNDQQGTTRGTLVLVRSLSQAVIQAVAERTNQVIRIYQLDDPTMPAKLARISHDFTKDQPVQIKIKNGQLFSGFALMRNILGEPILLLQIDDNRTIYQQGKKTVTYLIILVLIVAVILGVVIRSLLSRLLISQQEQAASQQLFKTVLDQSSEGFFLMDPQNKQFLETNPAYQNLVGYSEPELRKMHFYDLQYELSRELVDQYLEKLLRERTSLFHQQRRKDGRMLNLELTLNSVLHEGQEVLCGMVHDVTEHMRTEESLKENYLRMRQTLEETVHALAAIGEKRDPYTAGHQKRVAQLAKAIAQAMELPEAQVEGIRIAGILHDIGKIYIPSEILSKPGRITEIEYSLVKTHPQIGYDIVKAIPFDWPVALSILQHHERLDGTGYPRGIKGVDIILEARILAVADVVEAIASHRPYRPALGIENALEEVSSRSGTGFDPQVVATCLTLFNEGKFQFD